MGTSSKSKNAERSEKWNRFGGWCGWEVPHNRLVLEMNMRYAVVRPALHGCLVGLAVFAIKVTSAVLPSLGRIPLCCSTPSLTVLRCVWMLGLLVMTLDSSGAPVHQMQR